MEEEKFWGYIVTSKGIRANPEKTKAVMDMPYPSSLKKMQRLSAFQAIKKLIAEIPTLTTLMKDEELMVYLSAANEAVSVVLLVERNRRKIPIHYVSEAFQGHTIKVITDKPISQILSNREATRRLAKWAVELEPYGIQYAPINAIKGQVLANFLADTMAEDSLAHTIAAGQEETSMEGKVQEVRRTTEDQIPTAPSDETNIWKLYTNGASNDHGSGSGLVLIDPKGAEYSYALRLNFTNSNNDAEYDALLAGLRIASKMKVKKMLAFVDSKLVASQVEGSYEARGEKTKSLERRSWRWYRVRATIITNNETQLINNPFKSWIHELGMKLVSASIYHPQANGAMERANQSIIQGIKKRLHQERAGWVEELPNVMWAHRTMPKTSNGETPFSLAYCTEAVIPVKIGISTRRIIQRIEEENEEALRLDLNLLEERREIAAIREARLKQQVAMYVLMMI
ncbi:reverse transcriptase domain-containing protein [Tanacetum coccineum]